MNSSTDTPTKHLAPLKSVDAERFLIELANLDGAAQRIRGFQTRFEAWLPAQVAGIGVELLPYRDRIGVTAEPAPDVDRDDSMIRRARAAARIEQTAQALKEGRYRSIAPQSPEGESAPKTNAPAEEQTLARSFPKPSLARSIDSSEQRAMWIWSLRQSLRRVWEQPDQRTKEWGAFLVLLNVRAGAGARQVSLLGFEGQLPPPTLFEQALMYLVREADRARVCQNAECNMVRYFFAKRRSQKYCSEGCAAPAQAEAKRRWWADHGTSWRTNRKKSGGLKRKNRGN